VAELDGLWEVERTGGLLPPLIGVRKRIHGARGATTAGPLRAGFRVEGSELHYEGLFRGFVDVLEPDGGAFNGRGQVSGRAFGRFCLRRAPCRPPPARAREQTRQTPGGARGAPPQL
jgi:hypothetical protein